MVTIELDRRSSVPLYQQLEDDLKRRIVEQEWLPNQQIPSENELHRAYGLSRMTVRGVVTKLVNEGLLRRVPGKGTFVQAPKIAALSPAYVGIREQLEALGMTISTELMSLDQVPAAGSVRDALRLAHGDQVYAIVRRRSVDGEPISLHRSFVPSEMAPGLGELDVVGEQLCVVLENAFRIRMTRVEEELEAVHAGETDAVALGTAPGSAVLILRDVLFDGLGRPFEYSKVTFRGDKLRLRFTVER